MHIYMHTYCQILIHKNKKIYMYIDMCIYLYTQNDTYFAASGPKVCGLDLLWELSI